MDEKRESKRRPVFSAQIKFTRLIMLVLYHAFLKIKQELLIKETYFSRKKAKGKRRRKAIMFL